MGSLRYMSSSYSLIKYIPVLFCLKYSTSSFGNGRLGDLDQPTL